jgi:hypothetical protein
MELRLCDCGLVSGHLPGPLAGIVGYDVFARAIVEIPAVHAHTTRPSSHVSCDTAAPSQRLRLQPRNAAKVAGGVKGRAAVAGSVRGPDGGGSVRLLPPYRTLADMPPWMQALEWLPIRVVCASLCSACLTCWATRAEERGLRTMSLRTCWCMPSRVELMHSTTVEASDVSLKRPCQHPTARARAT